MIPWNAHFGLFLALTIYRYTVRTRRILDAKYLCLDFWALDSFEQKRKIANVQNDALVLVRKKARGL